MTHRFGANHTAMTSTLQSRIKQRTHGRLLRLTIRVVDHQMIVEACSRTYHGVQLVIAAIESFVADFPELAPARVDFRVNGRRLVLHNPFATQEAKIHRRFCEGTYTEESVVSAAEFREPNAQRGNPSHSRQCSYPMQTEEMIAARV